jgi:hypothetical protein
MLNHTESRRTGVSPSQASEAIVPANGTLTLDILLPELSVRQKFTVV